MSYLSQPSTSIASHPEYIFLNNGAVGAGIGEGLGDNEQPVGQYNGDTHHNYSSGTHFSKHAKSRGNIGIGLGSFVAQPASISPMSAQGPTSGSGSNSSKTSLKGSLYGGGSGSLHEAGRKITSQNSLVSPTANSAYQSNQLPGVAPVPLSHRQQQQQQQQQSQHQHQYYRDHGLSRRGSMPYMSHYAADSENSNTHQKQTLGKQQPSMHDPEDGRDAKQTTSSKQPSLNEANVLNSNEKPESPPTSTLASAASTSSKKKPLLPEHYNFDFEAYAKKRFGKGETKTSEDKPPQPLRPPALQRASPSNLGLQQQQTSNPGSDSLTPQVPNGNESARRTPSAAEVGISKDYDETLKLWKELGAQKLAQQQQQQQKQSRQQAPSMIRRGSVAPSPSSNAQVDSQKQPEVSEKSDNDSKTDSEQGKRKSNVERFWEAERERERLARALGVNRFGFLPQHLPSHKEKLGSILPESLSRQSAEPANAENQVKSSQKEPENAMPKASLRRSSVAPSQEAKVSPTVDAAKPGAEISDATKEPIPANQSNNQKANAPPVIPPRLHRPAWAQAQTVHEEKVLTKEDLLRMKAEIDARFARKAGASKQSTSQESNAASAQGTQYSYVNIAREKMIPTPRKPSKSEQNQSKQQAENSTHSNNNATPSDKAESASSFAHAPRSRGHRQSMPNIYENGNSSAYSYNTASGTTNSSSDHVYDMRLAGMSAVQIKKELERYGVPTTGLVERGEFAELLKEVWIKRERFFEEQKQKEEREQAVRRAAAQREREEAAAAEARAAQRKIQREQAAAEQKELEKDDARIIAEVELWAKNKPLYVLLNEVNGDRALKRNDTFAVVSKAYRRAIIQIHPDKHMEDHAKFVRATEMCKYVNDAYQTYRKQSGQ